MKFRLRVMDLDNPLNVAYMKILKQYGTACYPKELQDCGEYWNIPFDVYYPKNIVDEKTGKERLFNFYLSNVSEIHVSKGTLNLVQVPSRKIVKESIQNKKAEIRNTVEKDLIKVLGDPRLKIKFGKLKFALFGLQPVYRTIIYLLSEKYPTYSDIEKMNYLDLTNLITSLGYAQFSQEQPRKLLPTSKLFELFDQMKTDLATAEAFLGIMMANYYDYLAQTLRIIHFVPYVRTSTSYYGNAIEYGELIRITEKRLMKDVQEYYSNLPTPSLKKKFGVPTIVKELTEANVLEYEEPYVTGRKEIFNELIQVRGKIPISEEPYPV